MRPGGTHNHPGDPVPAMVVMIPELRVTMRMVLLPKSAMYTLPGCGMGCIGGGLNGVE